MSRPPRRPNDVAADGNQAKRKIRVGASGVGGGPAKRMDALSSSPEERRPTRKVGDLVSCRRQVCQDQQPEPAVCAADRTLFPARSGLCLMTSGQPVMCHVIELGSNRRLGAEQP